jgi:hypothetical protein
MATLATRVRPLPWVRPKYLLFAVIALMLAYVIPHDESFLVHPKDPLWQHYEPFRWWLLPHGIAGACALLLGPMQFSDRLRVRFRKLHCVVGRIYVAWMTRSFAVALVFLEVRVIGGLGGWENLDAHANETIVWFCLAFAILSADLVLQWQQLGRKRSLLYQRRSLFP